MNTIKLWWAHLIAGITANLEKIPAYATAVHDTVIAHIRDPKALATAAVAIVIAFVVVVDLLTGKRVHFDTVLGMFQSIVTIVLTVLKDGGWIFVTFIGVLAFARANKK